MFENDIYNIEFKETDDVEKLRNNIIGKDSSPVTKYSNN
jgi:hypothetical protein